MKIQEAKKAIEKAGYKANIVDNADGLAELHVLNNGEQMEIFFDCSGGCSTYLGNFSSNLKLVEYAEKSYRLSKEQS